MDQTSERFETWAIVELLGHRRLVGRVTEQTIAGAGFLRVDVPGEGEEWRQSQMVNPSSIYAITPIEEAAARLLAPRVQAEPIQVWELPENIRRAIDDLDDADQPF